jgi:spoIIIJ-associated protein
VATTLEEAIEKALEVLEAREDEVDVEILEEAKRGFLGFGIKRPYRVRVSWRKQQPVSTEGDRAASSAGAAAVGDRAPSRPERRPPPAPDERRAEASRGRPRRASSHTESQEVDLSGFSSRDLDELEREAATVTEEILRRMGMEGGVTTRIDDEGIHIAIGSERDEAILIGRRGETRAALQQIINRILSSRAEAFTPVLVDVAGYWDRRAERLRKEALELADRAVRLGVKVQSEPLAPQERRIIHRTLVDDPRVTTESVGKGLQKSVLIQPASRD